MEKSRLWQDSEFAADRVSHAGNLPKKEPETLEFWDSNDIYHKVAEKNQGHPKFILHDVPALRQWRYPFRPCYE